MGHPAVGMHVRASTGYLDKYDVPKYDVRCTSSRPPQDEKVEQMSATQSGPGGGHQLNPWLFVFDRQPRAPLLEKKKVWRPRVVVLRFAPPLG
jgi:hypothetical protein